MSNRSTSGRCPCRCSGTRSAPSASPGRPPAPAAPPHRRRPRRSRACARTACARSRGAAPRPRRPRRPSASAAACSSIVRAEAPHSRIGWMKWRTLREPSVSWLPYFFSSPGDCTMRTRAQSASSSSATIIGSVVRAAPVPISARAATMVTMPSAADRHEDLRIAHGRRSASCRRRSDRRRARRCTAGNCAASTRPPLAATPFSTPRRLTLVITSLLWVLSRSCHAPFAAARTAAWMRW